MPKLTKVVCCSFDVVGYHAWPSAPSEVAYLSKVHRHIFKIRVEVSVTGSDREVEFHILKRECLSLYPGREQEFGSKSCEHIAEDLLTALTARGYAVRSVEVSEDGENSARVEVQL